jgi:hypothetical protein
VTITAYRKSLGDLGSLRNTSDDNHDQRSKTLKATRYLIASVMEIVEVFTECINAMKLLER